MPTRITPSPPLGFAALALLEPRADGHGAQLLAGQMHAHELGWCGAP